MLVKEVPDGKITTEQSKTKPYVYTLCHHPATESDHAKRYDIGAV